MHPRTDIFLITTLPPTPISFQNTTWTNASPTKQSKPPPPIAAAPLTCRCLIRPLHLTPLPSSRYFDRQEDELARGSRLLPHHSHKVCSRVSTSPAPPQCDSLQDDAKDEDVLSEFRSSGQESLTRAAPAEPAPAAASDAADVTAAAVSNGGMDP